MSALGEKTLMLLLTDTESLQHVVREGLPTMVVPTPQFRPIVEWARAYYATNDKAPSIPIIKERWGDILTDHNLDPDEDVEESIDWACEDLKQTFVQQQVGLFSRRLATEVTTAAPEDRLEVLGEKSAELAGLVFDLQPRTTGVDLRLSGGDLLAEYEMAANADSVVRGMAFGIPEVDQYLGGIWDGELCTVAGFPGSGKSFFADYVAYHEWRRGRATTIFTLENSILMTQMRLACMALHVDIGALQSGSLHPDDVDRLRTWCSEELTASDTPLHILSPEMVNANPHALVQAARAYGTESLIIDQLSHVAAIPGKREDGRRNEVSAILRTISDLIKSGRHPMPCLMIHQINREGAKTVDATGRVHMSNMAESSEVERTSALVLALYASGENKNAQEMQLQMLKQRRVRPMDWVLDWQPHEGHINYLRDGQHPDNPSPAQEAHRPSHEETDSEAFSVQ